jgi:hypothetical protein
VRQTKYASLKAKLLSLRGLTTEDLVESFVCEAKFCDPKVATTYESEVHVWSCCAHASELARRDELPRLLPLLDSADSWLACSAAERLSRYESMENSTLTP